MRRFLILVSVISSVFMLSSCGVSNPSLYNWGGSWRNNLRYDLLAYKDYKSQTPEAICDLICVYEEMVSSPSGVRQVPPPGICAEYGYLLLLPDTASIFEEKASAEQKRCFDGTEYAVMFTAKGKQLLQKEMELYPESRKFIEPLMRKLDR